jgi:ADP-heptose:LPS heptosyltransferase
VLPKKILVLRFSAMGDVVLLVPVLRSLLREYPEVSITVATRPKFAALFNNTQGISVFPADVDHQHKGLGGIWKLFRSLHKKRFDLVVDEHDHLRTKILRTFFFLSGVPVKAFNKGRSEKKKFTRPSHKITHALPHTTERYQEVFTRIGFVFQLTSGPHLHPTTDARQQVNHWLAQQTEGKTRAWMGVAPFAMHRSKIWPHENYSKLFNQLLSGRNVHFFLFGGGKKELSFFELLKNEFPQHVTVVAGALRLEEELALMQQLDLMLCMDSSNMHLAALVGAPILSIWGGTHPGVGFGPFQRDEKSIIQINGEELPCRPCSVYGKETCYRGDFACMNNITPAMVAKRIEQALLRQP